MSQRGNIELRPLYIDLTAEIERVLMKIGEDCAKEIKARSPVRTGFYRDGWISEMDGRDAVVVHNQNTYRMPHLLEFGHRTKSGGNVPPQEHIRPAYNVIKDRYIKELEAIKITQGKN